MTALDWTIYAEASEDHRDVLEPDVARALHECVKENEIDRLYQYGRLS